MEGQSKGQKKKTSSYIKFFVWVVIVMAIPVIAIILGKNSKNAENSFSTKDLYEALEQREVSKLIVTTSPDSNVMEASGTIRDPNTHEDYEFEGVKVGSHALNELVKDANIPEYDVREESNTTADVATVLVPLIIICGLAYFLFFRGGKPLENAVVDGYERAPGDLGGSVPRVTQSGPDEPEQRNSKATLTWVQKNGTALAILFLIAAVASGFLAIQAFDDSRSIMHQNVAMLLVINSNMCLGWAIIIKK